MSNRLPSLRFTTARRGTLHPRIPIAPVSPCPADAPEHTTRICAEALAARLTAWWHERGWPSARFWPVESRHIFDRLNEHGAIIDRYRRWDVRSNLVNGVPPKDRQ